MDPAFWTGFFALLIAIVTLVGSLLKNFQQDKAALKRDFRIVTLETQHENCEKERLKLTKEIRDMQSKIAPTQ